MIMLNKFTMSQIFSTLFLMANFLTPATALAGKQLTSDHKAISYVFVQSAKSAVLERQDEKKQLYTLSLQQIPASVYYLSDRPYRITGLMSTEKFFSDWQAQGPNSFVVNPPNASLVGLKEGAAKTDAQLVAMVLSDPHYNATLHEVTYTAKLLGKNASLPSKMTLQDAAVFIDSDWCPSCCCGDRAKKTSKHK